MKSLKRFALCSALALSLGTAVVAGATEAININTASAEVLAQTIEGVGPTKAAQIVAYRDQHGPFEAVEDLVMVRGIGQSILEGNRHLLSVQAPQ